MTTETSTTLPCRLCGGPTELRFHQIVLNRHRVGFHECLDCNSLQTEAPFWLDEAYADPRPLTDVGIVQRTLDLTMRLDPLLLRFEATNQQICLDFGGNNGLFTRMMRDKGYNFFCYDRYVSNFYTPCHDATRTPMREAAVITAFEVLEHLSDPARDLDEIFGFDPDVVIATTETYRGQGPDWGYLSLDNGQHVFFYSLAALDRIATQRGYRLLSNGNLHIFHRLRPKFLSYGADASGAVGHWLLNPGKLETAALECFIKRRDDPYRFVLHDYSDIVQALRSRGTRQLPPPATAPAPAASRKVERTGPGRIVVDGVFYQISRKSGIARVWTSVLERWAGTAWAERLTILDRGGATPRLPGLRYRMVEPHDYADPAGQRRLVQQSCDREQASAFISTYYTIPLTIPSVLMVYDMTPEVTGMRLDAPMWAEKTQAIGYASHFICISRNTAADLRRFHPAIPAEAVQVAHLGLDAVFHPRPFDETFGFRLAKGLGRDYFVFVGPRGGYKNGMTFFQAWASLPEAERQDVVVVGGGGLEPELQAMGSPRANIHVLEPEDQELALLYAGATALVMPSLYEGFGLPVVEAMACGCPVICSRCGSLAEVAGEAALYVEDPLDARELAAALRAVQDSALRRRLVAAGIERSKLFTWQTLTDALREILEAVAGR